MSDDFVEQTSASEHIFSGHIIDVHVDDVTLPNGHTTKRELVKHPGAVGIIAVTPEQNIVLVKQYRKPLEQAISEIPAGKLEPGEDPATCAFRELAEETGYRAGHLQYLTSFYSSPGFCDECLHIYYCDDLTAGRRSPDPDEFVELQEVTLREAEAMVQCQEIYDAKTMYALQFLQLKYHHKEG